MVSEAYITEEYGNRGDVVTYSNTETFNVSEGSFVYFSGNDREVSSQGYKATSGFRVAGVARMDKDSTDGSTAISVLKRGKIRAANSAKTGTAGNQVIISSNNIIEDVTNSAGLAADNTLREKAALGYLLQDAAANEWVEIELFVK